MATKTNGGKQQASPAPAQQQERQKPAHEIRFGRVKLTLWENTNEKTGKWFSIVPSRTYRDGEGSYKSSHSFGLDDALPLAEALHQAFEWIHSQRGGGEVADGSSEIPF